MTDCLYWWKNRAPEKWGLLPACVRLIWVINKRVKIQIQVLWGQVHCYPHHSFGTSSDHLYLSQLCIRPCSALPSQRMFLFLPGLRPCSHSPWWQRVELVCTHTHTQHMRTHSVSLSLSYRSYRYTHTISVFLTHMHIHTLNLPCEMLPNINESELYEYHK